MHNITRRFTFVRLLDSHFSTPPREPCRRVVTLNQQRVQRESRRGRKEKYSRRNWATRTANIFPTKIESGSIRARVIGSCRRNLKEREEERDTERKRKDMSEKRRKNKRKRDHLWEDREMKERTKRAEREREKGASYKRYLRRQCSCRLQFL